MPKNCPRCCLNYPSDSSCCLACACPAPSGGFPNVALAANSTEELEMVKRYNAAIEDAEQRGALERVAAFEQIVMARARLVTACQAFKLFPLCDRDDAVFWTFQKMLHAQLAFAGDDQNNIDRQPAEEATLPGCSERIHFAALAIEDVGLSHYGNYLLIWRAEMVNHRSSVFVANCLTWRYENNMSLDEPAPPGNRAVWQQKHRLAVVKCAKNIEEATSEAEFSAILLREKSVNDQYDVFIEGHIWGPLSRHSLAKVVCSAPESKPSRKLQAEEIADDLRAIGIEVKGI